MAVVSYLPNILRPQGQQTFNHDPDSRLNYHIDWSLWLHNGDVIISSQWFVPGNIEIVSESFSMSRASIVVRFEPGTTKWNQIYRITNRIETDDSWIDDRSLFLKIRQL